MSSLNQSCLHISIRKCMGFVYCENWLLLQEQQFIYLATNKLLCIVLQMKDPTSWLGGWQTLVTRGLRGWRTMWPQKTKRKTLPRNFTYLSWNGVRVARRPSLWWPCCRWLYAVDSLTRWWLAWSFSLKKHEKKHNKKIKHKYNLKDKTRNKFMRYVHKPNAG